MAVTRLGVITVGACVPIAASAAAAALADLQAKLAGALEAQARLTVTPPSLAVSLDAALALVASLEAAIAIGLPSLDFQFAALAALIAELNASISVLLSLQVTLGAPGVAAYKYVGSASSISELATAVQEDFVAVAPTNAILLVASDAGAWAAMQAAFVS